MKTATKKTNSLILNEEIQLLLTEIALLDQCLTSLLSPVSLWETSNVTQMSRATTTNKETQKNYTGINSKYLVYS